MELDFQSSVSSALHLAEICNCSVEEFYQKLDAGNIEYDKPLSKQIMEYLASQK